MGYMGLGMQSWIYRMKPRRPYTMERKKSFSTLPKYQREFKIQPSKMKLDAFPFHNLLVFIFFVAIIIGSKKSWMSHSKEYYDLKKELVLKENNEAYNFLIDSGKSRLKIMNYKGAYSEFKLALLIYPESLEASKLLEETLQILCSEYDEYCSELDNLEY